MTNEIVTAVTNIVEQTGGNAEAVASMWMQIAIVTGSIISSLTVIATLDPTNKLSNLFGKIVNWFNILDPNKSQKK